MKSMFRWLFQRSRPVVGGLQPLTGLAWNGSLMRAWQEGDTPAVIAALEKGANPNLMVPLSDKDGETEPLIVAAARRNDTECLKALIAVGADVEKRSSEMFSATALGTALLGRKWEAARVLALAGASWEAHIWVLDPNSFAQAMVLGGLDPTRIVSVQTTLRRLATGEDTSLRDMATSQLALHMEPGMRHLLAELAAREKGALLEERLGAAEVAPRAARL